MMKQWSLCTVALTWTLFSYSAPENSIPFNGKTAYRISGKKLDLSPTEITLSLWVYLDSTDEPQVFLNRGRANAGFTFYLYKGRIRMLVGNAPPEYTHANVEAPKPKTWTHLTGTYDGNLIRLYVNGKPAATAKAPGTMGAAREKVIIGALDRSERFLSGRMTDIRIWNRCLQPAEVAAVAAGKLSDPIRNKLVAEWDHRSIGGTGLMNTAGNHETAEAFDRGSVLINEPGDGFRGIWYFNQKSGDEYVYKYSGGLGTYCAKHRPMAWYSADVNRTYFCYGGTDKENSTLYHMVSHYDHASGTVAVPTTLLDKRTTDAHDNPVINVDSDGYIWIFSSSHGKSRPSYISRSVSPHDISEFECVWTGNYSYPQPFFYPGKGFLLMHTWYEGGRSIYSMSSADGKTWSERNLIARIDMGHYQVCEPFGTRIGSAFNMHPAPKGLNWRSNLYYIQSLDFGKTWQNVRGESLKLPLTQLANDALVSDYYSQGLNVYMKDISYDSKGNPVILYITSKGYESGPENMPRTWTTAHWNGTEWEIHGQIVSDNNYDTGSLYIESDTQWRIIGPSEVGPQPYNPGGEIAMWLSEDAGKSWQKIRQMTAESEFNHTYLRRPINAQPEFYGIWADGHGRQPSESRLYFCNRDGDVFQLPTVIADKTKTVRPIKLPAVQ